jgi:hypothetical protein
MPLYPSHCHTLLQPLTLTNIFGYNGQQNKHLQFLISSFRRVLNVACNFWVVPQHVVFNSRRFGTLCLFHLHRRVDMKCIHSPMKNSQSFGTLCLFHLHRRVDITCVVFNSRRFGTLCLFHLHRRVDIQSPMKMEQTHRSELSRDRSYSTLPSARLLMGDYLRHTSDR